MEATPDQRQRLVEAIFKRNFTRRKFGMPPLDINLAYARGLNHILRKNLAENNIQSVLPADPPSRLTSEIIFLSKRRCEQRHREMGGGKQTWP